jgi:hypothetical protein
MQFSQLFVFAAALAVTLTAGARVKAGSIGAHLKVATPDAQEVVEQVAVGQKEDPIMIGGEKDENGCLTSAGYTWCESKQKCLRSYECNQMQQTTPSDAPDTPAAAERKSDQETHPENYKEIHADVMCSRDAKKMCPMCKLRRKTAYCEAYRAGPKVDVETFPIRAGLPEHGLPEEIQGVFWLTKQGSSSALVSFGQNEDGGGLSTFGENGVGKVRVSGDRVWSFHDLGGNFDSAEGADLIYTFNFRTNTAPRHAQIHPAARAKGIKFGKWMEWLLDFEMDLLQCPTDPKDSADPYCQDLIPEFRDSFVWQRKSYSFGIHRTSADYKAVQVIKADGTKLPAFYKWLEFCGQPEAGSTPGQFHYHEVDNSKKCFKKKSWMCRKWGKRC